MYYNLREIERLLDIDTLLVGVREGKKKKTKLLKWEYRNSGYRCS